jgi:hypothetical protein
MLDLTPQSPDDELIAREFPIAWVELVKLRQLNARLAVPGHLRDDDDPDRAAGRPHLTLIQGGRED